MAHARAPGAGWGFVSAGPTVALTGQEGGFHGSLCRHIAPLFISFGPSARTQSKKDDRQKLIGFNSRVGAIDVFWPDPVLFDEIAKFVCPRVSLKTGGVPAMFCP